jgi:hypothetical protein
MVTHQYNKLSLADFTTFGGFVWFGQLCMCVCVCLCLCVHIKETQKKFWVIVSEMQPKHFLLEGMFDKPGLLFSHYKTKKDDLS